MPNLQKRKWWITEFWKHQNIQFIQWYNTILRTQLQLKMLATEKSQLNLPKLGLGMKAGHDKAYYFEFFGPAQQIPMQIGLGVGNVQAHDPWAWLEALPNAQPPLTRMNESHWKWGAEMDNIISYKARASNIHFVHLHTWIFSILEKTYISTISAIRVVLLSPELVEHARERHNGVVIEILYTIKKNDIAALVPLSYIIIIIIIQPWPNISYTITWWREREWQPIWKITCWAICTTRINVPTKAFVRHWVCFFSSCWC